MAVLETIRNKFGILITVLIAIALLSFIIDPSSLSFLNSPAQQAGGEDITVAEINGQNVSYYDFNNEVQMLNNGNADRNLVRSQVMLKFIGEYLYSKNAKAAGFSVSDTEMAEALSGNIPSNIVAMYLGTDMTKSKLAELENNVEKDQSGRMKYWWENVLSQVKSERYYTKYSNYLNASDFENSLVTEDNMKNANTLFDVEFVMVPYVGLDDYANVEVSEAEVTEYYNSHKNLYKAPKSRSIDYLLVEVDVEDEEAVDSVSAVLENIYNAEEFEKAAAENGYVLGSVQYPAKEEVLSDNDKLIYGNENIYKWAFKDSEVGDKSSVFYLTDDENSYMAVALLTDANNSGYERFEDVASSIERDLFVEKAKDILLADVTETVSGLDNMNNIATALQVAVSTEKNVSFAKSELDDMFVGAASVAEENVVNAPMKGELGIYVYKVTNRHEDKFYTTEDAKNDMDRNNAFYQMNYGYYMNPNFMYYMPDPGYIKDYTYLYF